MLCDDVIRTMERVIKTARFAAGNSEEIAEGADTLARATRNAQRFVLSPLTVETAAQLCGDAKAINRTRDYLFTPAELTWIEWAGDTPGGHPRATRHGLLLIGSENKLGHRHLVIGWGAYVCGVPQAGDPAHVFPLIVAYDFPASDGPILTWRGAGAHDLPSLSGLTWSDVSRIDYGRLGAFLGSALALINTPRLSYVVEHDHSKANLARKRMGRQPILSYNEVRIALDRGELGLGQQMTPTQGRALHHVRTFLRLKRGKVEIVRPHWRGNPRFGVIRHRYVTFRAEDEPGSWQGGPLPGPQIIHALVEHD